MVSARTKRVRTKFHPGYKVTRHEWVQAACLVMAKQGIDSVNVNVLAKKFGATKGSFYWHFKNKQELLDAIVDYFEFEYTMKVKEKVEAGGGTARAKLLRLFDLTLAQEKIDTLIELAIRDWARHDKKIFKRCQALDHIRVCYVETLLREADIDHPQTRAIGSYTFLVGSCLVPEFFQKVTFQQLKKNLNLILFGKWI